MNRVVSKKTINKKELQKLETSKYYPLVQQKYMNRKIDGDQVSLLIAQILSSEFQNIDYYHPEHNGVIINNISDIILEEALRYILLI